MNILDRHIGTTIAVTTSLAMVLLLAFFFFASFVGELDAVGQGRYGLLQAFEFVLLTLPNLAYQLFPVVALLGSIIGLGILANSNELTAMRAAGVSIWRIAGSVMKVALLLVAATTIVGEWLAPPSEKYAQELRRTALEKRYVITKANGLWAREGRNFIHIRDVLADNMMGGVSIYEFDEAHQLRVIIQAQMADLENNVWVLRNVTQNQIGASAIATQHLEKMSRASLLSPDVIKMVAVKPEMLPFKGMYDYVKYLRTNGLNAMRYEQALWGKLVMPLTTGVMVFLAIPFVFGPLRSVGIGQRIMVGTLVGIGFHLFNQAFSHVGILYGLNSVFSVMFPTLLFFAVGLWLTSRVR